MRKAKEHELNQIATFMIDQFFEKEEMQQMFQGIDATKSKSIATEMLYFELVYFYEKGDIYLYDEKITGVIVGIKARKLFSLRRLLLSLKANKILKQLTNQEICHLKENIKVIREVHSTKWHQKYCKGPYYIAQFAIKKEQRGKGIAREMLTFLMDRAKKSSPYIVLETLTKENVPLYEHFGFVLKEEYETKDKKLTEYRMLKDDH